MISPRSRTLWADPSLRAGVSASRSLLASRYCGARPAARAESNAPPSAKAHALRVEAFAGSLQRLGQVGIGALDRHQHDHPPGILDAACTAPRFVARAEKHIRPLRALDGRPGVLRDHQPTQRVTPVLFHPDRRTQRGEGRIDGNRSHRRDRPVHRTQRALVGGNLADFAKKDIGLIVVKQVFATHRVPAHPVLDHLGGNLVRLVDPAPDQFLSDGPVGVTVGPAIAHANDTPVGIADTPRSLNLEKEQLDRIVDPGNLESPTLHHAARQDVPPGQPGAPVVRLVRHAIKGKPVAVCPDRRAGQFRLEITGKQRILAVGDQNRAEEQFEKLSRICRVEGQRAQGCPIRFIEIGTGVPEGRQRFGVIILGPTVQVLEAEDRIAWVRLTWHSTSRHETRQKKCCTEPCNHSPVATSCQFGSSAPIRRAYVQTSFCRFTCVDDPSMISPELSRTTDVSSPIYLTVISAVRVSSWKVASTSDISRTPTNSASMVRPCSLRASTTSAKVSATSGARSGRISSISPRSNPIRIIS